MSQLKLKKLPNRTPIKVSISLPPDLSKKLQSYAEFYKQVYGETENVTELVPYMLEAFLATDRAFVKWNRQQFD